MQLKFRCAVAATHWSSKSHSTSATTLFVASRWTPRTVSSAVMRPMTRVNRFLFRLEQQLLDVFSTFWVAQSMSADQQTLRKHLQSTAMHLHSKTSLPSLKFSKRVSRLLTSSALTSRVERLVSSVVQVLVRRLRCRSSSETSPFSTLVCPSSPVLASVPVKVTTSGSKCLKLNSSFLMARQPTLSTRPRWSSAR